MPFRPSLTENDIALLKRRTLVRIVDDDAELRDALQFLLEVEGWRVAAYDRAEDFLTSDAPSVPGCLMPCSPQGKGLVFLVKPFHQFRGLIHHNPVSICQRIYRNQSCP